MIVRSDTDQDERALQFLARLAIVALIVIPFVVIAFSAAVEGMTRENDKVAWACQQQAAARGVSAEPCGLTSDQQRIVDRDNHNVAEAARIAREASKRLAGAR